MGLTLAINVSMSSAGPYFPGVTRHTSFRFDAKDPRVEYRILL